MEKKGNRTSPVVRGTVADSKKDAVTVRQIPRSRRRETAGTSLSTKPDPSRKPQPQRIKTLDKRPKPRAAVGRNEATGLDQELEPALGSVFNIGSKKQSLNHLLNFSFATREFQHQGERGRDGGKGNREKLLSTKKHTYNMEHFLQANCQFIVNDSGNYKQYLNNPDALVDWNYIEQVNVQVSEEPSCPICLYPPSASKMTRCGHIYCWSCILHYLSLSDKLSRKCPVCSESINQKDLKSVVAFSHNTFNIAEDITFKLMKRPKGSLIAYPADADVKENVLFNTSEKEVYSKLLLAKNQDIFNIIEEEFKQLTHQILEDENSPEQCFIQQALLLLKERENKLLEKIKADGMENNEGIKDNFSQLEKSMNLVKLDNNYIKDLDEAESSSSTSSKFHYFYQANDGQHIYLHAINARMLEHAYGSLENSPKTISGIILEKEGGSMTEEIRRKLRYLQHLPLTCQFEVAEIQLKQPVVGKDTLDHFHEQIEIRRKRRQRRAKEEKRREKRIEAEENRKLGKYPVPNLHLESNIQFPEFGSGEPRMRSESESTLPSERSCSPDLTGASTSISSEFTGPSFAKMLATQKKQLSIWPTLKPTNQSSSLPVKLINVTGSKVNTNTAVRQPSDDELKGYEHAPVLNQNLGDVIAQALEQAEKEEEHEGDTPSSGKKKKKKSKQKVLFTTTMAYSGN